MKETLTKKIPNSQSFISLFGAKQNNLKNVHLEIPLYSFTVVCGPSGSGKSSLAFQTLYAEGQRRYIESLSNYSQQFIHKLPKPNLERIENIPPSVFIGPKNRIKSSHSVVGTVTGILDNLQKMYAKIGQVLCPEHNVPLKKYTSYQGGQKAIESFAGKRVYILSPLKKEQKRWTGKTLKNLLLKEGFLRIYDLEGAAILSSSRLSPLPSEKSLGSLKKIKDLKSFPNHTVYLVIDRLSVSKKEENRIQDSLSQAYLYSAKYNNRAPRQALILSIEGEKLHLNENLSCPFCAYQFPHFDSRLFDFNNPIGACSTCKGFGNILRIDPYKVIPNSGLSLSQGALEPFTFPSSAQRAQSLKSFCKEKNISIHKPWEDLPKKQKDLVWNKVLNFFSHLEKKKYKMYVRIFLSHYKSPFTCQTCQGRRLKKEAEQVILKGKFMKDFFKMTLEDLLKHFSSFTFSENEKAFLKIPYFQMITRLECLTHMGLGYLTLDRPTKTLSGGEFQRLCLSKELSKNLSQILYILDEPTIGLHPRDTEKLIDLLETLRRRGNTLLVVEHDQDIIQHASHIIEMGPSSGIYGGKVIYSGNQSGFLNFSGSNTAPYLKPKSSFDSFSSLESSLPFRKKGTSSFSFKKRPVDMTKHKYILRLIGCCENNLKNVDVSFPLRRLVSITGVSGSGKSSLISKTLYTALTSHLKKKSELQEIKLKKILGLEHIKEVFFVDQSPIGKTVRSIPLSYLKIYTSIRELMASTERAKALRFTPGHFSLNLSKGRCSDCEGLGYNVIPMIFMDDIQSLCETCEGKKFNPQVLEVRYKGKNINDILNLTVEEALNFFLPYPMIRRPLLFLKSVGLDYIRLGQSTQSLSGGENQRLKIAQNLSFNFKSKKDVLYIMDEPTKGLHFREVHLLLKVLYHLVNSGHSVIVIEHNLEVIKHSDYIIDLGPEAERRGGKIVAKGSPLELIKEEKKSLTAQYLKKLFHGRQK